MHWSALGIGFVLGAGVAFFVARGMGGNPMGLTGGFARPFQPGVNYPR